MNTTATATAAAIAELETCLAAIDNHPPHKAAVTRATRQTDPVKALKSAKTADDNAAHHEAAAESCAARGADRSARVFREGALYYAAMANLHRAVAADLTA